MATRVTAHCRHRRRLRRVLSVIAKHLTFAVIAHVLLTIVQLVLARYLHG